MAGSIQLRQFAESGGEGSGCRIGDKKFTQDVAPLVVGADSFDAVAAYERVHDDLIARLAGEPWKGLPVG
jgi:hypothetical protein